jgi:hypothetical protein
MSKFIQMHMLLPPLKLMAQSRHGATHLLEAYMHPKHPLTKAISRFIQPIEPLLPLKPMAQLRRGVT